MDYICKTGFKATGLAALALLILLVPGCPTAGPEVGRPITTDIPQGIYVGDLIQRSELSVNGVLVEDSVETKRFDEIVDVNGLPLVQPGGDVPVPGLSVTRDFGFVTSTLIIESVNAFGNRLSISYSSTFEFEGGTMTGTGLWSYNFIPPSTLEFDGTFDAIGVTSRGDTVSLELTSEAVFTSDASITDTAQQPTAGPAAGRGVAGKYTGEMTCRVTTSYGGDVYTIETTTQQLTVTLSGDGLPVTDGIEPFVGDQAAGNTGYSLWSLSTTSIAQSPSEVVIAGESVEFYDCNNTCGYFSLVAPNGRCGEIPGGYCEFGTDCFDCGPFEWDATWTVAYLFLDDETVHRSETETAIQPSPGGWERLTECTALLSL